MSKRTFVLTIAVLALLLSGAWLVLDRDDDVSGDADHPASTTNPRIWQQLVQDGLRDARTYGLAERWPFSAINSTATGMPLHLRREALEILGPAAPLRLHFDEARYVRTPIDFALWVVPGRGVTCMFRTVRIVSSCRTTVYAYRHGMVLQTAKPGTSPRSRPSLFTLTGIAPDWTRTISVRAGRELRTIPIIDNVFADKARVPFQIVRLNR
jgi:hypothetical protein